MASKQSTQVEKFKQVARELETDNDEKRFNERLGTIAKQKPSALRDKSGARKPPSGKKD